ncbi:MAG: hypothetical protein PHW73_10460 [Atribacterota bacterium]|nr:hypothetical protein [Atribacterota bacterium]
MQNVLKKEGFSKTFVEYKIVCLSLNKNGRITDEDVREMFKLSNRITLDEIDELIELLVFKFQARVEFLIKYYVIIFLILFRQG